MSEQKGIGSAPQKGIGNVVIEHGTFGGIPVETPTQPAPTPAKGNDKPDKSEGA